MRKFVAQICSTILVVGIGMKCMALKNMGVTKSNIQILIAISSFRMMVTFDKLQLLICSVIPSKGVSSMQKGSNLSFFHEYNCQPAT